MNPEPRLPLTQAQGVASVPAPGFSVAVIWPHPGANTMAGPAGLALRPCRTSWSRACFDTQLHGWAPLEKFTPRVLLESFHSGHDPAAGQEGHRDLRPCPLLQERGSNSAGWGASPSPPLLHLPSASPSPGSTQGGLWARSGQWSTRGGLGRGEEGPVSPHKALKGSPSACERGRESCSRGTSVVTRAIHGSGSCRHCPCGDKTQLRGETRGSGLSRGDCVAPGETPAKAWPSGR